MIYRSGRLYPGLPATLPIPSGAETAQSFLIEAPAGCFHNYLLYDYALLRSLLLTG